ncbi:MAG: hypothetical protein R3D85_10935 [Paracoccaceae bacterium]
MSSALIILELDHDLVAAMGGVLAIALVAGLIWLKCRGTLRPVLNRHGLRHLLDHD